MKSLMYLLVAGLVVGGSVGGAAQGQGRGRGQGQGQAQDKGRADDRSARPNVVFSERDVTVIRKHYGARFKNLPPGLQKKLARGGSLPPGWEKKIEPFPASLERDLVVLGPGRKYGIYDGQAVIYDPLTHAILDIVSLF